MSSLCNSSFLDFGPLKEYSQLTPQFSPSILISYFNSYSLSEKFTSEVIHFGLSASQINLYYHCRILN